MAQLSETEQIVNLNWTFVVNQPTLSCISFQNYHPQIFTEVLKPKPVTTETVTIDTRTFLEDSSNLYRVALAEKKPRL